MLTICSRFSTNLLIPFRQKLPGLVSKKFLGLFLIPQGTEKMVRYLQNMVRQRTFHSNFWVAPLISFVT